MAKRKQIITAVACGAIVTMLVILSLQYDYCKNQNCATMISGLWSAAATAAVGIIAFWQNRLYKKMSDDYNDLALMPDVYYSTSLNDAFCSANKSTFEIVRGEIDENINLKSESVKLWFIKGPIVNLLVTEIVVDTHKFICPPQEAKTFRNEAMPFIFRFNVPVEYLEYTSVVSVSIQYENIYGTKYQKTIRFSLCPNDLSIDSVEMERAKRIV